MPAAQSLIFSLRLLYHDFDIFVYNLVYRNPAQDYTFEKK